MQGVNEIVYSASPFVLQAEDHSLTDMPSADFADYADIRDVAETHLLAHGTPTATGKRILVAAAN